MKPEFENITYEEYCDYLLQSAWEYFVEKGLEPKLIINDRLDDTQINLKPKDRRLNIWLEAWLDDIIICYELGNVKRCTTRPIMSWEWMINCRWYLKKKNITKDIHDNLNTLYPSHTLDVQIKRYLELKKSTT